MINSLENLEKKLGYAFDKKDLLKKALTHISKSNENNETLEFLGDAVINLSISDLIIKNFPNVDEGILSLMRSKLVSRDTLNKICLLYTSPSPRDRTRSRMPSSA